MSITGGNTICDDDRGVVPCPPVASRARREAKPVSGRGLGQVAFVRRRVDWDVVVNAPLADNVRDHCVDKLDVTGGDGGPILSGVL